MAFVDPTHVSCEIEMEGARAALREIAREEWQIEEERKRLDEREREVKLRKKA
jgi:hypothetical protein